MVNKTDFGLSDSGLVLIEFQEEWLNEQGKLHHLLLDKEQFINSLENAKKIIAAARNAEISIIHSGLSFSKGHKELGKAKQGLRAGIVRRETFLATAQGSCFSEPFKPQSDELVVSGRIGSSAFAGSNLDSLLRNNQIHTLYLMGYALHVCVESTLRAAHDLGYETILIEDACASFTAEQKRYVLNEVVHHFGKSITTQDFLNLINV